MARPTGRAFSFCDKRTQALQAILARVPKGTEEVNMKAFDEGWKAAEELLTE